MKKKILGVNIDDISAENALSLISDSLKSSKKANSPFLIATPGPEFLVTAQKDKTFKTILNEMDINLPDGVGLQIFGGVKNRVPGVSFLIALCKMAAEKKWTVGMIGNLSTQKASQALKGKFPNLSVSFALDNPKADEVLFGKGLDLPEVDILFVGVGHPKQEKFLWESKNKQESNKKYCKFSIGMGVGGSFDEVSGQVRAPHPLFEQLGLKWLGRLIIEPKRFKRIINASIVFPWLLLTSSQGK